MATLRELFDSEFGRTIKCSQQIFFSKPSGEVHEVPHRLYCDFDACACFLGCYIGPNIVTSELLYSVVRNHAISISRLRQQVNIYRDNVAIYQDPRVSLKDLPFTGRIVLYVDAHLGDILKKSLGMLATELGVWLQVRDRKYEEFITVNERPLGFISHDSRDKDHFVRPLAEKLRAALCPVWYDEFSLQPGMSLRESIDAGLRRSKRCVIVLSQNFLNNPGWGKAEFNAAVNRHVNSGGGIIIPIWHGVTRDQVAEYSQIVSDLVAINSNVGDEAVFRAVHRALIAG